MNKKLLLVGILCLWGMGCLGQSLPDYSWGLTLGDAAGDPADLVRSLARDGLGNVYVGGEIYSGVDLDPGPNRLFVSSRGSWDGFVAKYDSSGQVQWGFSMGAQGADYVKSILVSKDGNLVVAGTFSGRTDFDGGPGESFLTPNGQRDAYFAKYTPDGNLLWVKNVGGTQDDLLIKIAEGADGSLFITGITNGVMDYDPSPGVVNLPSSGLDYDIYFAKYSAEGDFIWAQELPGNRIDAAHNLVVDDRGYVTLTGFFGNSSLGGNIDFDPGIGVVSFSSSGDSDAFVARYDSLGNYVWVRVFAGPSEEIMGGLGLDEDGNAYLAGQFASTVDFDGGPGVANHTSTGLADIVIVKYDSSGNYLWSKSMGSAPNDKGTSVELGMDGDVYVGGSFSGTVDFDPGAGSVTCSSTGGFNAFFARYSRNGDLYWVRPIGGPDEGSCDAIILKPDGGIHVGGHFEGAFNFDHGAGSALLASLTDHTFFVGSYDSLGAYGWALCGQDSRGGDDEGRDVALDGKGNVYVTGSFKGEVDFDPSGAVYMLSAPGIYFDAYFAKYNANGGLEWAHSVSAGFVDQGKSIQVDDSGYVYVMGAFNGTADFDPGPGSALLTPVGRDIYVAKYDSLGNYVWAFKLGAASALSNLGDMVLDADANVYVTGMTRDVVDFDPGPGTSLLGTTGTTFGYFAKYDRAGNYLWAKALNGIGECNGIAVDSAGSVFVGGAFQQTMDVDPGPGTQLIAPWGGLDIFVGKYDALGGLVWAHGLGGTQQDVCRAISVGSGGEPILTGVFSGTVDFDPSSSVIQNLSSAGGLDIFMVRYQSGGGFRWAKRLGGTIAEEIVDLALDGNGNVYLHGSYTGTPDFDPGPGTALLPSGLNYDLFVAVYDAQGNYLYANTHGGTSTDGGGGIAVDAAGRIAYIGTIRELADLDPSMATDWRLAMGGADAFLMYLGDCDPVQLPQLNADLVQQVCDTTVAVLHVTGGQSAGGWTWFADQCGSTVIHQGDSLLVNLNADKTYYVAGTGGCVSASSCVSIPVTVRRRPVVGATVSATGLVCVGEMVVLQASGANNYQWSGGVNNGVPFAASTAQTYTVVGTATNGCTDTASVYLNVSPNPVPVVNVAISPNDSVCAGRTVTLTGSGASQYQWSAGVSNGVAFTPMTSQAYQVIGTDAFGCSDTAQVIVRVLPLPVLGLSVVPNDTVCAGTAVTLTGGGAPNLVWSGGISNGAAFVPVGSQSYTLVGSTAFGCADTLATAIEVFASPVLNVGLAPNDTVCTGTPLILNASGAISYTVSGGGQIGVPFSLGSSQVLEIVGLGAGGCNDTVSVPVVVHAAPLISISVFPNDSVCAGMPLTLTASGAATVNWSGGVVNGVPFIPSSSQTYFAFGSSVEGCTGTAFEDVTVLPLPVLSVTVSPNDTVCVGTAVTLTGSGGNNLVWTQGVSNGVPFVVNGSQTYVLTGESGEGCEGSYTQTLTVLGGVSYVEPETLVCLNGGIVQLSGGIPAGGSYSGTGARGGMFDPQVAGLGLHGVVYAVMGGVGCSGSDTSWIEVTACPGVGDGLAGGDLRVFPNPGEGLYQVEWTGGNGNAVRCGVLNGLGQMVVEIEWLGERGVVDLHGLAEGVYVLRMVRGEETVMRRVVKLGK